jgi:hypothetical protein
MPMPAGTEFSRCTMVVTEGADSTPCTPGLAAESQPGKPRG